MKRLGPWILAAALLLSLVSCNRKELEPSPYGEADFDTSGDVALTTDYPAYDSTVTSYQYAITNNTEDPVTFGQAYSIEVYAGGAWKALPLLEDVGWDDVGYQAAPGERVTNAFSFWPYDFTVVDGTYRLIKAVTLGDGETRILCREFTIGAEGPSTDAPGSYVPLEELPEEIDLEDFACDAATDAAGTLVAGSQDRVSAFLDKVAQGTPATLRLVSLTQEGDPILYDVVFANNHFLYRVDRTRDAFAGEKEKADGIYEQRYSYLVTDGENLYLSDYASLDYAAMGSRHLEAGSTVILCFTSFEDGERLAGQVEEMTQQRVSEGSAMARYWSEDGAYWVDLTAEKNAFSVSTKGYGVGRSLPPEAGEDAEIYTAQWTAPDRVQLLFTAQDGQGSYRAVYDVEAEEIVFIEERA